MDNVKKFIKAKNEVSAILWQANVWCLTLNEFLDSNPEEDKRWLRAQLLLEEIKGVHPELTDELETTAATIWSELDQQILNKI